MIKIGFLINLLVFSLFCTAQNSKGVEGSMPANNSIYALVSAPESESYIYKDEKGKVRAMILIPEEKERKRVRNSTLTYAGATVASFGILYAMPEDVTNWDKDELKFDKIIGNWWDNVSRAPVVDEDGFFLNYVMHPYFGGIYYMSMRGAGYKWWQSSLYSAGMSTFFWEYGIEAIAERPSIQDLVSTPVLGSGVGELFYQSKKAIKNNEDQIFNSRGIGRTVLFLVDPLNEVQDIFTRKKMKNSDENFRLYSSFILMEDQRPGISLTIGF